MEIFALLRPVILLGILAVAAVTDVIRHRVGNRLLLAGVLLETAVHIAVPGSIEPDILGCYAVFLAALFVLFVMRLLGGADVKLYALCMLTYPNDTGFRIAAISVIAAAVWSVYVLTAHGLLKPRLRLLQTYLIAAACGIGTAYIDDPETNENDERVILPMAVFIFIGAFITVMRQT